MIPVFFNILFFLIPLLFFKNTSELFEFNKIITLYLFTTLIVSAWIIQSIRTKKIIFRKTILDWPLVIYLSIYFISTLLSIDPRTSWFGYYSRFNGGLISQICYALLYWTFVSNLTAKQALHTTYYILLATVIASILAIGEKFGIFTTCGLMGLGYKESCWVQDVQNRVFSTLGQPNWLAALLVALIPISWAYSLKHKAYGILSVLFFVTLLFTKSRSGLLAFGFEFIIFWSFQLWKDRFKYIKEFIFIFLSFSFFAFIFWFKPTVNNQQQVAVSGPALESGGTESGTIRKYVWLGAIEVFKHYPILGTGPESFAYSFPMYKPVEHNLTSEWDFIYNKAHNEFLNYLANTGILGFISYLSLIIYSIIIFGKSKRIDLLAGYLGILITNFFGFSVVPVSLLFFLLPAIAVAVASSMQDVVWTKPKKLDLNQWFLILGVLLATYYIIHTTYSYWLADMKYNKSKTTNSLNDIEAALKISPNEPIYISQLASLESNSNESIRAITLNPYNQNIRRILISNLVKSSGEKRDNLLIAEKVIQDGISISPNDPRLYYQLGVLQLKLGKNIDAIESLNKSVTLKPNYKDGRFALGLTYIDLNNYEKAKENFEYILKNIDPNDELTKKYLNEIN